jgi:hypothetical protein
MNESPKKPESTPEHITASAVRYKGTLFTAETHAEALIKLFAAHPDIDIRDQSGSSEQVFDEIEEGFTTSHNRFISPDEADALWSGKKIES